jgi:hypothetical protein
LYTQYLLFIPPIPAEDDNPDLRSEADSGQFAWQIKACDHCLEAGAGIDLQPPGFCPNREALARVNGK